MPKQEEIFEEIPREIREKAQEPIIVRPDPPKPVEPPPPPEVKAEEKPVPKPVKIRLNPKILGGAIVVVLLAVALGFNHLVTHQKAVNESQLRLAMGNASLTDGDLDHALYNFTRALEINPKVRGAHAALGRIALARGRGQDAASHFMEELDINPGNRESHLALGCLNALGCVSEDDPRNLRGYLLGKFPGVLHVIWSEELTYTSPEETDPLAEAIYNFQAALETNPDDPLPGIGLALSHLATYDLASARERLNRMLLDVKDEIALGVVREILSDVNDEEMYLASIGQGSFEVDTSAMPPVIDFTPPTVPPSTENLNVLPPLNVSTVASEGFGTFSDAAAGYQAPGSGSVTLTERDFRINPTVKPINNDIYLEESSEWLHTVRIANVSEPGSVGFREGETIVMPNTNAEITVLEVVDDERIVIKEGENVFVWIPGDIGWVLEPAPFVGPVLNISASRPGEAVPESEQIEESPVVTDELGPEISPD